MNRNLRALSFFCFVFFACEEAIIVDVPSSEPRLVIDAVIGYSENNGDPFTIGQVKLTLTAPFFVEEVPLVENAMVQLIDESTGELFPLTQDEPGIFRSGFPDLVFDRDYTLEVIYEDEIYRATESLSRGTVIENVEQGDGFLFDEEDETEVIITFTDIPNERNTYLFSFDGSDFIVIDDEFIQDQQFTFSFFFEGLSVGEQLIVILLGIDDDFADYTEQVLVQSGESGGAGPFATPPATLRGNILNVSNSENYPFGYFAIGELDATIFIKQ
ncbi:MAG: hypothetical protein AAFZ89_16770 [Bacteroidota bacterium]